jgi:hypothetical protein
MTSPHRNRAIGCLVDIFKREQLDAESAALIMLDLSENRRFPVHERIIAN